MNITRYQLMGLGASKSQVDELIKGCKQQGKEGRSTLYSLTEVIQAVENRLENKRIRKDTRKNLEILLQSLQELSPGVISIPFGANKTEAKDAVQQLIKSAQNPNTLKHRIKAAEIKGKRVSRVR